MAEVVGVLRHDVPHEDAQGPGVFKLYRTPACPSQ